jgi:hypothetical protein
MTSNLPDALPRHRTKLVVTEERKRTFLRVLSETGSWAAACTAATPGRGWTKLGMPPARSTFGELAKKDPVFAAAVAEAEGAALAKVETEVMRRAMTPTARPIFSKGTLVGYTQEYDNRLLVTLARRLNPEGWAERQKVEHSGEVRLAPGSVVLNVDDINLLGDAQRDDLIALLEELADAKERLAKAEAAQRPDTTRAVDAVWETVPPPSLSPPPPGHRSEDRTDG